MSATQLKVGERLVQAMGNLVNDEKMVNQVVYYILSLQNQPDAFMSCADLEQTAMPLEESRRSTLEMVHQHFQSVEA